MILVRVIVFVVLAYLAWMHPRSAMLVVAGAVVGPRIVREIQGG